MKMCPPNKPFGQKSSDIPKIGEIWHETILSKILVAANFVGDVTI